MERVAVDRAQFSFDLACALGSAHSVGAERP
jgi:hypothetical protein